MAPELKTETFLIRMTPTEADMLRELSERSGLTRADVLRQAIRKQFASVVGSKPAPKRRKR